MANEQLGLLTEIRDLLRVIENRLTIMQHTDHEGWRTDPPPPFSHAILHPDDARSAGRHGPTRWRPM